MTAVRILAPLFLAASLCACLPELPQRDPYLVKPPPAPAGIRLIPHTFALSMISGRKVSGLTLEAFRTGTARTRGEAVSSLKSYHAKVRLDVPAFLIRHPKQGPVLFDTGLGPEEGRPESLLDKVSPYAFLYRQRKGRDVVSQLKAAGVEARDVRWVILSRLDHETVGMVMEFSSATVVVSRREWESCSAREGRDRPCPPGIAGLEGTGRLRLIDLHNAPALAAFENAVDLFDDGTLFLVSLPGRTPGNMGAWMNMDRGPVLLTGGACFVVDNYLDLALPVKGMMGDIEDYWSSLHIIHAMREAVPQLLVVPGSDLGALSLIRWADITPPPARGR
ncbi:MAG: MBL fold metallo-hydrolase [Desulfobaccales bacterium]